MQGSKEGFEQIAGQKIHRAHRKYQWPQSSAPAYGRVTMVAPHQPLGPPSEAVLVARQFTGLTLSEGLCGRKH